MKKIVSFVGLFFSGLAFVWGKDTYVAIKCSEGYICDVPKYGQLLIRNRDGNWEIKYQDQDDSFWMGEQITPVTQVHKRLAIFWRAAFF
jgi:hypothetical protein